MDNIYIIKRIGNKNSVDSIIGQKGQCLYHLTLEKFLENNHIHKVLQKSFEYCTIKKGDSPQVALFKYGEIYSKSNSKYYRLIKINVPPGYYYPRIYRPFIEVGQSITFNTNLQIENLREELFQYPEYLPCDIHMQLLGLSQLGVLKDMLISIFDKIHPSTRNLKAFGQSIKNLLVLSCIEVETQLKGIYKANETTSKKSYNTQDYVKLKKILQLDKYYVSFPFYPDLNTISPFKMWSSLKPTKSLSWFESYNAIKHNSEVDFDKATLKNAIYAFCALAVLINAQYGKSIPYWNEKIGGFIEVFNRTSWGVEESILPPLIKNKWISRKIGF